ncbi:MAG: hypothetical protein OXI45_00580 [Acidobacteriota bacterium]|nr:hypothetical protein [Acidobacteriota bacterium]
MKGTIGVILVVGVAVAVADPMDCDAQANDQSLLQREDSAGVQIVEALRPL